MPRACASTRSTSAAASPVPRAAGRTYMPQSMPLCLSLAPSGTQQARDARERSVGKPAAEHRMIHDARLEPGERLGHFVVVRSAEAVRMQPQSLETDLAIRGRIGGGETAERERRRIHFARDARYFARKRSSCAAKYLPSRGL